MPANPTPPQRPPKRLPRGLKSLWQAIRDVAETTGRGNLARQLGVSTHTLQRILMDGEIPRFPNASVRQLRSWTRTLARLAHHFNVDPSVWIRAAGIPWDEEARRIARDAVERARGARTAAPAPPRGTVEAGVVVTPRLADGGGADAERADFLTRCVQRVIACVDPSANVVLRRARADELIQRLRAPAPKLSLAAGLLDSATLRAHGLRMLQIPGWRPALSALHVRASGERGTSLRWEDLAHSRAPAEARYVVAAGDAAEAFLRAHWGIPEDRLHAHAGASAGDFAAHLAHTASSPRTGPTIFVADEGLCRATAAVLARERGVAAEAVAPPAEEAPRFPLALVLPAGGGSWSAAVEHAWHEEMFGPAKASTAQLYADAMRRGSRLLLPRAREMGLEGPSDVRPVHFREADPHFQRVLSRELLAGLLAERGLHPGAGSHAADALSRWEETMALAHAVIPPEWRPVLDSVAWAARRDLFAGTPALERPYHAHCQSCSTSLREYPGPSTSYCRFCADEEGHLRSREEVHELIAQWMEAWQGDLTHERAMERAARYMSAMPAWSEN